MIRIVLIDAQTLIRSGIVGLLSLTEDIRVVTEAADGEQALAVIAKEKPDFSRLCFPYDSNKKGIKMHRARHLFLIFFVALFGISLSSVSNAQQGTNHARMLSMEDQDFFQVYQPPKSSDQADGFVHKKASQKTAAQIQSDLILSKLNVVHDLVKKNELQQALAELEKLDAIPNKTAQDNFLIDRTRLAVAATIGDTEMMMKSTEAVIASGLLPTDEKPKFSEFMAIAYYNKNDYSHSLTWAKRYFDEGGTAPVVRRALVFSHFFNNDFTEVAQEVKEDIFAAENDGKKPNEDELRLLVNSEQQLKNQPGYIDAMEKYVSFYPKKEYWANLLNRVVSKPGFPERLTLDVYRLMLATDQVHTAKDYTDMSQVALQSGYAIEAKDIVERGFQSGTLGTGTDAAAHKQLRALTKKAAAKETQAIDKEAAAIIKGKRSNDLVTLGFAYVERGMLDKGIGMMEQGLKMGGLERPSDAKLHLAIAYIRDNRKGDAEQILKTIEDEDGAGELARYWLIHLASTETNRTL